MSISNGDKIPSVSVKKLGENGMEDFDLAAHIAGRKVLIFGVPGAFTPACAGKHLPGYIENTEKFREQGIQEIICIAVNDPFVMKQWGKTSGATGKVTMVPDGNAVLTKAMGLEFDGSGAGLGIRSKRFSLIAEDGVISNLQVEAVPGEVELSSAGSCLMNLKQERDAA